MFSNIIAGFDGYSGGRDAVVLAKALASGRITLVDAYPVDLVPSRGTLAGYEELLREETTKALERAREEAGVDADLLACPDSSPARALHQTAEKLGADLIVVGAAHHGPVGRLLLGDVGRAVMHDAPCPVAVAPKGFDGGTPRTVAVGFDGSPESRAALDLAADYAREQSAALTVLVAWEDPAVPIAEGAYAYDLVTMREDRSKRADALLAETLAGLPTSVAGQVLHGRPDVVLVQAAENLDLLFVGSRGWGPVKRVTIGSTADRVVHHASCPVIVVPRPADTPEQTDAELGVSAGTNGA